MFYDRNYDEMRQSGDDIIVVDKPQEIRHYCQMFKEGIDNRIIDDKKKCSERISSEL